MSALENENFYKENLPDFQQIAKDKVKDFCQLSTLTNRLPILKWLPQYKPFYLIEDCIAGLTVGLTAIPQGIAYAIVAGLQPQYGLYSAFMGCFVYILFGSCKDVTVGPTAIMALMIQSHVTASVDFAILMCFLAGCIITLLGILNLGFLVQFISMPVTIGFTAAAAITIGSGQINSLFGIPSSSNEFYNSWKNFFTNLDKTKLNDSLLGVITFVILILLQRLKNVKGSFKIIAKYISLSRNALAVIVGTVLAYCLSSDGYEPFRLTGKVESGIPTPEIPPFQTFVNGTEYDFSDMISTLGSSLITIPLVAILESIAIAKAFSKGKTIQASQEMIALGLCNIGGSFFHSMPITGSFTRTAVNNASGVRTPLGGAITGILILLALGFLAHMFYYIPKTTLSAIIISAMIFMIDYEKIYMIWKSKKLDLIPFIVTVIACLFLGLEYGILCGVGLHNAFILLSSARPKVQIRKEKINSDEILHVELPQMVKFSAAEYIKDKVIERVIENRENISFVVLNGEVVRTIDSTVAVNLLSIHNDLEAVKCKVVFWKWRNEAAGVICRMNKDYQSLFINTSTLEEVNIQQNYQTTLER